MIHIIHAPNIVPDVPSIFLAGTIDMGESEDWQSEVTQLIVDRLPPNVKWAIMNPRRPDWDSSWKQTIEDDQFRKQVVWELNGLESANCIIVYFGAESKSPITLLELGLVSEFSSLVVLCEEGYWRKGNVDIVCAKYGIHMVTTKEELADYAVRALSVS